MDEARADVEALFSREYVRLVQALALTFGLEPAADAVQEAFIQADLRWKRVSGLEDPAGWVRRVSLNRLLNGQRDRQRRLALVANEQPEVVLPDDVESRLDLRHAIAALPRQMRLVVSLHYLADVPVDSVAELLGIAPGTVKSTLHTARERLRPMMEDRHG